MKLKKRDRKLKISHFSWLEYVGTWIALGCLAAAPAVMYGANIGSEEGRYIIWYVLYWALIAGIFCAVTAYQKYRAFDRPMRLLSNAAKQVANGDFSVYVNPMHTADKLDYIDAMFLDFNKMVAELGSIETMKSNFIANVSHEVKTPLAVIQNYATALQDESLAPEMRKEYIDTVIMSSQKLAQLVTNMLKLNKIENQIILPDMEMYDLCRQLSESALAFEDVWEKKNIEFVADMDDRAFIRADKNLVEIVWNNLLSNALKFTEPGGKIRLKQSSEGDSVTVSLSDTGCGMDEETTKHIFDQFYQGDTSHSAEGNGLGLALSKRVVELVGGSIAVDSERGKGTTFTVHLKVEPLDAE